MTVCRKLKQSMVVVVITMQHNCRLQVYVVQTRFVWQLTLHPNCSPCQVDHAVMNSIIVRVNTNRSRLRTALCSGKSVEMRITRRITGKMRLTPTPSPSNVMESFWRVWWIERRVIYKWCSWKGQLRIARWLWRYWATLQRVRLHKIGIVTWWPSYTPDVVPRMGEGSSTLTH